MNENEYDLLYEYENKNWWFIAKQERLRKILLKKYIQEKERKILDMGCGVGTEASLLKEFGKVILVDNASHAVQICQKRGFSVISASAEMLPFKKEQFDDIFAIDVIEHIQNDTKAVAEWHSICQKNGSLFITTSAFQWLYNEHDFAVKHFRRYTKKELQKKLEEKGFEIVWINYGYLVLFIPLAVAKIFNTILPFKIKIKTETLFVHPLLNFFLLQIMRIENALITKISFPFGTALICEARKK